MNSQNTLFLIPLLVEVIFILVALIIQKFPPKKINWLYGYRSKSSMKTKECWNFAQRYSSKLLMYCGLGLAIFSTFGLLYKVSDRRRVVISIILIVIAVIILFYKTEKAIKQNFINE